MATCAYIDLNPVAAGIAEVPEASPYTSITTRVENVEEQGRTTDLKAAEHGSLAGSNASADVEESLWLCPIEDRRNVDSSREGMLEGLALGSYLLLVDFTGRLFRDGKAVISAELTESSIGWAPPRKPGKPGSKDSSPAACSAGSSPPVERGCAKSPHA